jgi:putative acetyltransferase
MIPDYDIRYSDLDDLAILKKWFEDPSVCDDFSFGNEEKEEALKNWIGFSRFKASLTGMIKGKPCAVGTLFLMPYKKVSLHCSFQLFVAHEHRRKKIATSMVRNLLNLAKTRFKLESVHVEIYAPNPLIDLVKKLGFEEFAVQENYVKINGVGRPRVLLEHFFSKDPIV